MTTQELVERLLAGAVDFEEFSQTAGNSLHRDINLHRAKLARTAASRLSEMEAENKRLREALRNLCASLDRLGDNGVYVIDTGLAHAYAASRAALEHQQKGEKL